MADCHSYRSTSPNLFERRSTSQSLLVMRTTLHRCQSISFYWSPSVFWRHRLSRLLPYQLRREWSPWSQLISRYCHFSGSERCQGLQRRLGYLSSPCWDLRQVERLWPLSHRRRTQSSAVGCPTDGLSSLSCRKTLLRYLSRRWKPPQSTNSLSRCHSPFQPSF